MLHQGFILVLPCSPKTGDGLECDRSRIFLLRGAASSSPPMPVPRSSGLASQSARRSQYHHRTR
jgi:hypothetical protein